MNRLHEVLPQSLPTASQLILITIFDVAYILQPSQSSIPTLTLLNFRKDTAETGLSTSHTRQSCTQRRRKY
jgi:hypothetical protein